MKYQKTKKPKPSKGFVDKVAEIPSSSKGEAHTAESDFASYEYPAYGDEIEAYPAYGETQTDYGYETDTGSSGDDSWTYKDPSDWDQ